MPADVNRIRHHLFSRVFNRGHAIQGRKLDEIVAVITSGDYAAFRPSEEQETSPDVEVIDDMAIVHISGTLVKRTHNLHALSGLRSYGSIRQDLETLEADSSIESILLYIDSPGGEVDGLYELTDFISELETPTVAFSDRLAASAAYCIAAAANEFYITDTTTAGSIGVRMRHVDMSEADKKYGYKYTNITSGKRKADGDPHSPLSEESMAVFQSEIDQLAELFFQRIQKYRGISLEAIRAMEAGVFIGQKAIDAGLADGFTTFNQLTKDGGIMADKAAAAKASKEAAKPTLDTVEAITAKFPEATSALIQQGIDQERDRWSKLEEFAIPGHEDLLATAKTTGMPLAEFLEGQTKAEKDARGRVTAAIDDTEKGLADAAAVPAAPAPIETITAKAGEKARIAALPAKERAAEIWKRDPKVRAEFIELETFEAHLKSTEETGQ